MTDKVEKIFYLAIENTLFGKEPRKFINHLKKPKRLNVEIALFTNFPNYFSFERNVSNNYKLLTIPEKASFHNSL